MDNKSLIVLVIVAIVAVIAIGSGTTGKVSYKNPNEIIDSKTECIEIGGTFSFTYDDASDRTKGIIYGCSQIAEYQDMICMETNYLNSGEIQKRFFQIVCGDNPHEFNIMEEIIKEKYPKTYRMLIY